MSFSKRALDLSLALVLLTLLILPAICIALLILIFDGRPVLYRSERMGSPQDRFELWKFRTMLPDSADNSITAGHKSSRVTGLGRFLRRTRFDEIPQLFNILRGDMSFVGPRPPLPRFAALCPEIYQVVLRARPGLTGLATLLYHGTEERLLSQCKTRREADMVYMRQCIPAKAALDLYWARHRTVWFDLILLLHTIGHVFFSPALVKMRQKGA